MKNGYVFLFLLLGMIPVRGQDCHPAYEALKSFFEKTNGSEWRVPWNVEDCNVCNWQGVECQQGMVTGISLDNNGLSGTLGSTIFENAAGLNLRYIILSNNSLTGTVPSSIAPGVDELYLLSLTLNDMGGALPESLNYRFENLLLNDNDFTGTIPAFYLTQPNANLLLAGNDFNSVAKINNTQDGLISFDGNFNNFSVDALENLTSLSSLQNVQLVGNSMEGNLPSSITNWKNLKALNLSNNKFTGSLPRNLNQLADVALNLSGNNLSGCYPIGFRKAFCRRGISLNISGNPELPSFQAFCESGEGQCVTDCRDLIIEQETEGLVLQNFGETNILKIFNEQWEVAFECNDFDGIPCRDTLINGLIGRNYIDYQNFDSEESCHRDTALFLECSLVGTPCDDNNPCTINDQYDTACNCVGTPDEQACQQPCEGILIVPTEEGLDITFEEWEASMIKYFDRQNNYLENLVCNNFTGMLCDEMEKVDLNASGIYDFWILGLEGNTCSFAYDYQNKTVSPRTLSAFKNTDFTLYPNPAFDQVFLESSKLIETLQVFDAKGRQMLQTTPHHTSISIQVTDWQPGLYIAKYQLQDAVHQLVKFVVR